MLLLAPLILAMTAALGAGICHWAHHPVYAGELTVICIAGAVATEASLLVLRFAKGPDQASATQAGLAALVLLMLTTVGLLMLARFVGLVSQAATTLWSPVVFTCALVLVAVAAVRTIRRAPAALLGNRDDQVTRTGI